MKTFVQTSRFLRRPLFLAPALLACCRFDAAPVAAAPGSSGMAVQRSDSNLVVTFRLSSEEEETIPMRAQFVIPTGKGLLGPSSAPGDQRGFANRDNTVFALNNQPVTKSSYVYVFVREGRGGLRMLDNVNQRIAKLLPRNKAALARLFLRVERIDGRVLTVQTVDFTTNGRPSYKYRVAIANDGSLRLR